MGRFGCCDRGWEFRNGHAVGNGLCNMVYGRVVMAGQGMPVLMGQINGIAAVLFAIQALFHPAFIHIDLHLFIVEALFVFVVLDILTFIDELTLSRCVIHDRHQPGQGAVDQRG